MTGKQITLTVLIVLAFACLAVSFYLFKYTAHWNMPLLYLGLVFVIWGVLAYYRTNDNVQDGDHSHH